MRTLIFGGTGFVGSHLARMCHNRGDMVFAVNRRVTEEGSVPYQTIIGDVCDLARVEEIINETKPDFIYNCVGLLTRGTQEITEEDARKANEIGSNNIVDAIVSYCTQGGTILGGVFLGSMMEYGLAPTILQEDVLAQPLGSYGESKHRATCYMIQRARQYNLPLVSARLFTPYGKGMSPDSLVARICVQAKASSPLTLSGKEVTRDFIEINDVVEALIILAQYSPNAVGEIFNVGSGQATTLETFVNLVLKISKSNSEVLWDESRVSPYDKRHWKASIEKITTYTNWRPKISLDKGLHSLLS